MEAVKLYHRDIGFPKGIILPTGRIQLTYTKHAIEQATLDKYGAFDILDSVFIKESEIFEIEVTENKVTKIALRTEYDDECDLVLVIRGKTVITQWLNIATDKHITLKRQNYSQP